MPAKKRPNDPETGKKNKKEKRGELAVINSDLRDESVQKGMRDAWQKKESYTNGNIHLDCEPFPHCQSTHFLQSKSFVESLQAELLQLNFNSKSNDLYKFQQSDDLRERKEHHISQIRSVIFGGVSCLVVRSVAGGSGGDCRYILCKVRAYRCFAVSR